jgi:beta-phosphoglucomutase
MQAVVFDFDGVIVDSEPMHERAIRAAFHACALPANWTDWRRYAGHGDRNAFRIILEDQGVTLDERTYLRVKEAKQKAVTDLIARGEPAPYPGAIELLRRVAAHIPTGVASGSRPHEVHPILRRHEVFDMLRTIVTADDVRQLKPDPEPYLKAAAALGAEPRRCIAIEDTPVGIRAGVAAGFTVVAVEHTNAASMLSAAGAHHVVPRIADLTPDLLREITTQRR